MPREPVQNVIEETATASAPSAEFGVLRVALGLAEHESPFPWQEELLECFLKRRDVGVIDIATGLGKTAVTAIWLLARALGAKLPRRLAYVVDRRAVVDRSTRSSKPEVQDLCALWLPPRCSLASGTRVADRMKNAHASSHPGLVPVESVIVAIIVT